MNKNTVVALGNFDGLHCGHRAVLRNTVNLAETHNLLPVALLFTAHPRERNRFLLMTNEEKCRQIEHFGLQISAIDFQEVKDFSPEEFVKKILIDRLHAKAVCCGYNYHFGKGGRATAEELSKICEKYNAAVFVSKQVQVDGEAVSSTKIRSYLAQGNVVQANKMLGAPFSYCLEVVDGDKRGRTMGFPTINQYFPPELVIPKFGVYASEVYVNGRVYKGITNIGRRPTIGTEDIRSETNILSYSGSLYGRCVRVALVHYIRGEMKFDSIGQLKEQIERDKNMVMHLK